MLAAAGCKGTLIVVPIHEHFHERGAKTLPDHTRRNNKWLGPFVFLSISGPQPALNDTQCGHLHCWSLGHRRRDCVKVKVPMSDAGRPWLFPDATTVSTARPLRRMPADDSEQRRCRKLLKVTLEDVACCAHPRSAALGQFATPNRLWFSSCLCQLLNRLAAGRACDQRHTEARSMRAVKSKPARSMRAVKSKPKYARTALYCVLGFYGQPAPGAASWAHVMCGCRERPDSANAVGDAVAAHTHTRLQRMICHDADDDSATRCGETLPVWTAARGSPLAFLLPSAPAP